MFHSIYFFYDENGNRLVREEKSGAVKEAPRILRAAHMACRGFYLLSTSFHGQPEVQIRRYLGDIRYDPYNDDGRPPTVITTIHAPTIDFRENVVSIKGFERGNMSFGGRMIEPYDDCRQAFDERPHPADLEPMDYITREQADSLEARVFLDRTELAWGSRQAIMLVSAIPPWEES